jgi:hypothetical protein
MDAIADGWRDRRGANRALVVEMKWKGTINILLGDGKKMVEIYGAIGESIDSVSKAMQHYIYIFTTIPPYSFRLQWTL